MNRGDLITRLWNSLLSAAQTGQTQEFTMGGLSQQIVEHAISTICARGPAKSAVIFWDGSGQKYHFSVQIPDPEARQQILSMQPAFQPKLIKSRTQLQQAVEWLFS